MAINAVGRTTIQGATTVGGFNPATLFSAGEQGVWYDPSDLSTLFQDSAGTIPVTALEQPVGRILDKSGRGNHATQSTNTSFRPVVSARVNVLTYTDNISATANWYPINATTPNSNTLQDDTSNTIHYFRQGTGAGGTMSLTSGITYICRVRLQKGTIGYAGIHLNDGTARGCSIDLTTGQLGTPYGGATASAVQDGSGWVLTISVPVLVTTATGHVAVYMSTSNALAAYTGTGSGTIFVSNLDVRFANQGVGLPVYQRVGAAVAGTSTTVGNADYNANGFPVYLKFDGSNDYMDFPALAISNQTILFGVQPASAVTAASSSQALLCTTSGDVSVISFGSTTATLSNERISWLRVSTAVYGSGQTSEDFAASPYVLTFTYATTPSTAYNRNAVSKTLTNTNAAQPNGGAFTATIYPTNYARIGAREDATLPFNGNLYGLIVRGASSTANQITGAENWLNQKTAAY